MTEFAQEAGSGACRAPAYAGIACDTEKYQAMLEESDLSDAQKREFIETLWQIMVQFVDLGFGVHPLQSIPSDAKDRAISLDDLLASVVNSGPSDNKKSNARSALRGPGGEEES